HHLHPPPLPTRRSSDLQHSQPDRHIKPFAHQVDPAIAEIRFDQQLWLPGYELEYRRRHMKLAEGLRRRYAQAAAERVRALGGGLDRKSTRLNSSHVSIS